MGWGLGFGCLVIAQRMMESSFCDGCAEFVGKLGLSPVTRIQPHASQGS